MNILWTLLAVAIAVGGYVLLTYNHLVRLRNRSEEAWADIDVQLKRRYDLIPNLIESVKGYVTHERETLDAVTKARTEATKVHVDPKNITPEQIKAMSGAEGSLTQSLSKLLAVAESYPDLKASQNFSQLQTELSDTENKIQAARRFYNTNVRDLAVALQSFPSNMVGHMFEFTQKEYFHLD